jgi:hypothetical protein
VIVAGHTYTVSGTYIDTLTGHLGGDSIITLNLTVRSTVLSNIYDTICQGSSYSAGGHIYTQAGVYVDSLTGRYGCDSIRALHLTVQQYVTPSVSITVSHGPVIGGVQIDTFTASYTDCADPYYTWFQNITPLGIHSAVAVVSSPVGVPDSVTCRLYCSNLCQTVTATTSNSIHTGITEIASIGGVKLYPNPTTGAFSMEIEALSAGDAEVSVSDLLGQSIQSRSVSLREGYNKEQLSIGEGATSGVYIISLTMNGQSLYYRIVLQREN